MTTCAYHTLLDPTTRRAFCLTCLRSREAIIGGTDHGYGPDERVPVGARKQRAMMRETRFLVDFTVQPAAAVLVAWVVCAAVARAGRPGA